MVNTIGFIYSNVQTERELSSVTGVNEMDFHLLVKILEKSYMDKYKQSYFTYLANSNKEGIFSNYEEMLFLYLYKLKTGLTSQALSPTFGVAEYSIRYQSKQTEELLLAGLSKENMVPVQCFKDVEEIVRFFELHQNVIIDAVEHGTVRPKDKETQKERYSGKKKSIQ